MDPQSSHPAFPGSPVLSHEDYQLFYFTQLLKRRICAEKYSQKIGKVTDLVFHLVEPFPEAVGSDGEEGMGGGGEGSRWERVIGGEEEGRVRRRAEDGGG